MTALENKTSNLQYLHINRFFKIPEWSSFPKFVISNILGIPPTINVAKVTLCSDSYPKFFCELLFLLFGKFCLFAYQDFFSCGQGITCYGFTFEIL